MLGNYQHFLWGSRAREVQVEEDPLKMGPASGGCPWTFFLPYLS